jgi:protein SCO1/2
MVLQKERMVPRFALFLLGAIALLGLVAGTSAVMMQRSSPWPTTRPGGGFAMQDTSGQPVTEADFKGGPSAFYFGFTHCPDACPTALFSLSEAMREIGPAADRLRVAFVTVDPERDTAEQMKLYLQSFDPRIRGLVGSQKEVDEMAAKFHVVARRVPGEGGDYVFDHSTTIMLFDAAGRLVGGIDHDEAQASVTGKLKRLLTPNACVPGAPASLWEASVVKGSSAAMCN